MKSEKFNEIVPDDSQHTTYMDVGSAENARSNFLPTYMDVGSAENASLHGCNLLGQCRSNCRGSNFQPLHPWRFTGIVPYDSQHTTHMDVGSAENAGAIFSHSIHGDSLESFLTILSIHSIHGDKKYEM